jgi:tripartite-type tricarboxylate transporter receptor subunit TctC
MDRRAFLRLTGLTSIGLLSQSDGSWAQNWPQHPVKIIVPIGPGSTSDICARTFADKLSAIWQQPVVVENRPGGDAIVGILAVISANDDHTLLLTASGFFTPQPYVHEKLPYDAKRDLVPVAGISELSVGIAVPQSLNVDSLTQLVSMVRTEPGKLNWGAIASIDDFIFSAFLKSEGLIMARVPYRDPISALNDLSEARIDICNAALSGILPRVQTGKVKVLAITNPRRSPAASELPTATEAGYSSLTYAPILGIFGSRALSAEARARIAADLKTVTEDSSVVSRLAPTGQEVKFFAPAAFTETIEQERAKIAAIAKMLDIRPAQ